MRRPRHALDGARRWPSTRISCSPKAFESLHRFGGPAVEFSNGHKQWFWKGKFRYAEIVIGDTTETKDWPGRYERTETKDRTTILAGFRKLVAPDEFKFPGYEERA